ncbi:MAG: tRNA (adenosine(37)-N6)-threonylcarbamoyltransferase complex dimerization subunit type 1 TsaB [Lentimicrobium sp.]|jgi:tRNA threonylcarbamoyladenosine biosynthesis protein TsaB|nr:tRNA (adenosine(37)-N6)-threonylcarbamoyltransferase complex dimerization subunit type 1 TsaB [Lentimicrobium sp.]
MSTLLCIETATVVCSVALVRDGSVIGLRETQITNSHAAMVAVFIDELIREHLSGPSGINGVVVSSGPGSYTGLRIGVSTAKGLCYALDVPLLSIQTTLGMAWGMKSAFTEASELPLIFAPMIDARRMEVYTAMYNNELEAIAPVSAQIIQPNMFEDLLEKHQIILAGDGAEKCKAVLQHPNLRYINGFTNSAAHLAELAAAKFEQQHFEDTAYFEPFYLKDFIAGKPRVKGLD